MEIKIFTEFWQHAEEVHGERSMLAAEAQGLQSWLLSVSNERDKSLGIIDEVRDLFSEYNFCQSYFPERN